MAALVASLKVFTWPVLVWLLATRRLRASGWVLAVGVTVNVAACACLGFGELGRFVHLSGEVTSTLYHNGIGVLAFALHLGFNRSLAISLEVVLSAALLVSTAWAGWRGRDQTSMTMAIALMLVAAPLVWTHYPAFVILPLALGRPRLSALWLWRLLLWVCPAENIAGWQVGLAWIMVGATLAILLRWPGDRSARRVRAPRVAHVRTRPAIGGH